MAEEKKTVEVPAAEAPAAEPAAATEAAPAAAEPAAEAAPAEAAEAPKEEAAPAAEPAAEAPKEEVKPIEEGILEAKGTSFPKNFLYTKKFFWFGNEKVSAEDLAAYVKSEKVTETANHVVSWASETGKGLLFYGEKQGEKASAHGVINLADASEPVSEGSNKFQLTSKGHKHVFKATTKAERDNWVSQIKVKIAEAKELASTVTESEAYKTTLESLKPAKKEAPKEEEKKEEAAPAEEPAKEEAAPAEEAPKEEAAAAEEAPKEEKKEEKKEEAPKRRSASRKRASIFGNFIGKKDEKKEEKSVATEAPVAEAPAEAEAPKEEAAPATEAAAEAAPAEEAPKEEKKEEPKAAHTSKRQSIFGNLGFSKKKSTEVEAVPAPPAKDTPAETAAVSESAPVIPAVETTEPLTTEVAAPAAEATAEASAEAAPATNGETKKEVKSDKRKSSLPFTFGKKDKSDDEGEKKSPFSKLRATVRLNRKEKAPATKEEAAAEEKPAEGEAAKEAEAPKEEAAAAAPAEAEAATPAAPAAEETAEKPAPVAAPQVAATA